MASDHLQHATTTSPCLMEVPAPDKGLPEPDTGTAAFLAMSHDMQLPLVTNQQASFHHLPPVDWNARLLQGYQASHAARLQQRSGLLPHALAVTSPSVPFGPSHSLSPTVDWTADLHRRCSQSFSSRLQHRRQSHDPYIKRASIQERFHELSQRSEDLKQQDAHLKKDLQYLVEECQHNGRLADKRLDKVDAFIDSHLQEKKELQERLKVVHAWRKHIRGLRRKSSGREQYDEYSQKLKDGPPPGWKP
ncbi:hypothetical protein BD769DRAFT_1773365 [Suillus cothurnatus]|nr:hypothetical protein BD769DRAFT_1773365 [Suillus cothurnatus]